MRLELFRMGEARGDDDLSAALVRNRGPRGPQGRLDASVHPTEDGPCA